MKKILIIGSTGMLGRKVAEVFRSVPGHHVHTVSRQAVTAFPNHHICDLARPGEIGAIIRSVDPDFVINCSGITNLNLCEQDHAYAKAVHVDSTREITANLHKESYYFHISTDSVFNGSSANYSETDRPDPLNKYASTKFEGDEAALASHQNSLIIRVNIFGGSSPGGTSLLEWGLGSGIKGTAISGYTNVYFNPVYVGHLAEILLYLVEHPMSGILNAGSREVISKYDFLKAVFEKSNLDESLLSPSMYEAEGQLVKRPVNTSLDLKKLSGFYTLPSIYEGIAEAVKEYDGKKL